MPLHVIGVDVDDPGDQDRALEVEARTGLPGPCGDA